jgi:hypothetical protein
VISLQDYELEHPVDDDVWQQPPPRSSHAWTWTLVVGLVVLAIGGGLAYYYYSVSQPAQSQAPRAVAAPQQEVVPQPQSPSVTADDIALPPLPETDSIVRQLVGALSSHSTVAAWLTTKGLIANFTVVALNVSEGKAPTGFLRAVAPRGRFRTTGSGSALALDPRSYERYDGYAEAVTGLDATGTARLYLTLKPRIQDAYRELGYPDSDFDRILERAIGELLRAPVVNGNVALRPKVASFAFADPKLESLSSAQKQFLRMGPQNVQAVQAKLKEIATLLNLHPEAARVTN